MFNPPEFYIASLLYEHMNTYDFCNSLRMAFHNMICYTNELNTYYYEHYYKYNKKEAYNIFSYKTSFEEFYKDIKSNNIADKDDLFDNNMAFKSDVYSISFILKTMKKNIIFDDIHQRLMFNTLFDMMYALNPHARKTIQDIIEYLQSYTL